VSDKQSSSLERLPDGLLGDHVANDGIANELIRLARSGDPDEMDKLLRIGMRRGLRHARLVLDGMAVEIAMRSARDERKLGRTLLAVTLFSAIAHLCKPWPPLFRSSLAAKCSARSQTAERFGRRLTYP
jgi:hypothetical protein